MYSKMLAYIDRCFLSSMVTAQLQGYHTFLAGIFVGLGYDVESNKEHGTGRSDILLKDKRN